MSTKVFLRILQILCASGFVALFGVGVMHAQAPTGTPSRLRVLSLGANTAAPSTNGNITATGTVTANNFVGSLNGILPANVARLDQTNFFTSGANVFTAAGGATIRINDSTAPVDERVWVLQSTAGQFRLTTLNDGGGGGVIAAAFDRTATAVDSLAVNAPLSVNAASVNVVRAASQESSFGAQISGTEGLYLTANNSAGVGAGLMPASSYGLATAGGSPISFALGGTVRARVTSTGLESNGVPILSMHSAVLTSNSSRASTATPTCDAGLTVALPNVAARYRFSADLIFVGGGITANGWRVTLSGTGGTGTTRWFGSATTNTTTANATPISNGNTIADPFTATFNASGIDTFVTLSGVFLVTAPASPTVCVSWAQNTINATATVLQGGSGLFITRLN